MCIILTSFGVCLGVCVMSRYNVCPVTTSPLDRDHPRSPPPPGPLVLTTTSLSRPRVGIFVKKNGHVTLIHAGNSTHHNMDDTRHTEITCQCGYVIAVAVVDQIAR